MQAFICNKTITVSELKIGALAQPVSHRVGLMSMAAASVLTSFAWLFFDLTDRGNFFYFYLLIPCNAIRREWPFASHAPVIFTIPRYFFRLHEITRPLLYLVDVNR